MVFMGTMREVESSNVHACLQKLLDHRNRPRCRSKCAHDLCFRLLLCNNRRHHLRSKNFYFCFLCYVVLWFMWLSLSQINKAACAYILEEVFSRRRGLFNSTKKESTQIFQVSDLIMYFVDCQRFKLTCIILFLFYYYYFFKFYLQIIMYFLLKYYYYCVYVVVLMCI